MTTESRFRPAPWPRWLQPLYAQEVRSWTQQRVDLVAAPVTHEEPPQQPCPDGWDMIEASTQCDAIRS